MKLGISLVLESDVGASSAGLVYRELRMGLGRHALILRRIGDLIMTIPPWKAFSNSWPNAILH